MSYRAYDTVVDLDKIAATPEKIKELMSIHNLSRLDKCNFKSSNKSRDESTFGFYCWTGIIEKDPKVGVETCRIARTCDPYSFTNARTKFCLAFDCKDPYAYINPGDSGTVVANRRGGVVVRNADEKCTGLAGVLSCLGDSTKQSIDNLGGNPATRNNMIITVGGLIALAVGFRLLRKRKKKINLFNRR